MISNRLAAAIDFNNIEYYHEPMGAEYFEPGERDIISELDPHGEEAEKYRGSNQILVSIATGEIVAAGNSRESMLDVLPPEIHRRSLMVQDSCLFGEEQ